MSTPGSGSADDSITLSSITLECPDGRRLAAFDAAITGGSSLQVHPDSGTGDLDATAARLLVAP